MEKKQRLVYAPNVNLLDKNIHSIKKNKAALLVTSKDTRIEVNTGSIKYGHVSLKAAKTKSLHKER
jgi:hypothetical protein